MGADEPDNRRKPSRKVSMRRMSFGNVASKPRRRTSSSKNRHSKTSVASMMDDLSDDDDNDASSDDDDELLQSAFAERSHNHKSLKRNEFKAALKDLGMDATPAEMNRVFTEKEVDYEKFRSFTKTIQGRQGV